MAAPPHWLKPLLLHLLPLLLRLMPNPLLQRLLPHRAPLLPLLLPHPHRSPTRATWPG